MRDWGESFDGGLDTWDRVLRYLGSAQGQRWPWCVNAVIQMLIMTDSTLPWLNALFAGLFIVIAMHMQIRVNELYLEAMARRLLGERG
jgi:hypothetical protein